MITFKRIRWKNLLSSGNTWVEIELDKCHKSLIAGENGAGKSTLLDALSLVLYGTPFRSVNKPQLLNTINNKELVVEIEFFEGAYTYFVRRGIKPTIFEVYKDGTLLNQDSDSKEYQEYFEKYILKMNHKSFSQIVVLGSAAFVPFMQLKRPVRREVTEDLLDIQIFTTMNLLLKEKVTGNKDSLIEIDAYIDSTKKLIEVEKQRNLEQKQNAEEIIAERQTKIGEYDTLLRRGELEIRGLESEVHELRKQIKTETTVKARHKKMQELYLQLQAREVHLTAHVRFFEENDECPTCNQDIPENLKTKAADKTEELQQVHEANQDLYEQIKEIEDQREHFEQIREQIVKYEGTIREMLGKITFWASLKKDVQADIEKIKQRTKKIESASSILANAERELLEYETSREELIHSRAVNEMAGVLLKDNGIKTKIVRQYIPIINKLVNKYLASMDFFVNFELDENFQEKIKSRFRDEFTYESFSEGEKARLDLALLFTWRAIAKMRNSASTNLLILDEVFDGSLDVQGTEELLRILDTLTTGNNVFVITHKTDAFIDKFERVIRFEKHKNFSRIVEAV